MVVSPKRREDIIDALRRGTVPQQGLDVLAVGLDRFEGFFAEEFAKLKQGGAGFKALQGEYGSGKTFASRWLCERAKRSGFVTAEVQISETETPLHRHETVYRRIMERLSTSAQQFGAFQAVLDQWFFTLEQDVEKEGLVAGTDAFEARVRALLDQRLTDATRVSPIFAQVVRAIRIASAGGDDETARGLVAWLSGQPNVAASIKRRADIKGDIDHDGALQMLAGLLTVIRDCGFGGLVVVLDEVETLQRVRSDVREKGLNALRGLLDELAGGRFPGLFMVITGTPAFFTGTEGVQRLAPLAQRLHTDFRDDPKFDNPRAPRIRLRAFDFETLLVLGSRVRDIYASGAAAGDRLRARCDDAFIEDLSRGISMQFVGKAAIAPRIFLKKLIDILDGVNDHPDFDPRRDGSLKIVNSELTEQERAAIGRNDVDDIEISLP
ncbi:MAG: BREX system ATP-binding protein BrxD [Planctomycetes bacterium]|nr:BREX system ATP-binding protein BrxD [Planctomycetota bacterium]